MKRGVIVSSVFAKLHLVRVIMVGLATDQRADVKSNIIWKSCGSSTRADSNYLNTLFLENQDLKAQARNSGKTVSCFCLALGIATLSKLLNPIMNEFRSSYSIIITV